MVSSPRDFGVAVMHLLDWNFACSTGIANNAMRAWLECLQVRHWRKQ
jgi:hypothetical protein